MKVAYLVNRYPAVSHSFIRREISGLEIAGADVTRYSVRRPTSALPDERDRAEYARTHFILEQGLSRLLWATLCIALSRPRSFASALMLAIRSGGLDLARILRNQAYLVEACWLARDLADIKHLHAHFGTNPASVARLVHRLTGKAFSFTVHGPDEYDAPVAHDLKGKCAEAAFIVAISDFGRSQLMRWSNPADWDKIKVVRCGVEPLFLENHGHPDYASDQICCVARLSPQKGIHLLVEATAQVLASSPGLTLCLVGDGESRQEIDRAIADLGLADRVTITGYVDAEAVKTIMSSSRVMVLPSFAEGLPVVIMEALALGLPVISTRIAGIPELVDKECGWLVTPGNVADLVAAMKEAMSAVPGQLQRMGDVGRERVVKLHDAWTNAADLYTLLQASAR